MSFRVDISAHDDTELGSQVRAAYAEGRRVVVLVDSSEPDERADTWVDGWHGLYRLRCENNHVWLTALRHWMALQPDCGICGKHGSLAD